MPDHFAAAQLKGSWNAAGLRAEDWSTVVMQRDRSPDGCPAFTATVDLVSQSGTSFDWGVELQDRSGAWLWGIATESGAPDSLRRVRSFQLAAPAGAGEQEEVYHLNHSRRLGAQRCFHNGNDMPGIRFSAWAPNARSVEVCIPTLWQQGGDPDKDSLIDPTRAAPERALRSSDRHKICGGHIADGQGPLLHRHWGPFAMSQQSDGIWATDPADPQFARFSLFDHAPYMFRVTKDDGSQAYRGDTYSRCQIGSGTTVPSGTYFGRIEDLDGTISCSVVVDPDCVAEDFYDPLYPERNWLSQDTFFANPAPSPVLRHLRLQDLVIYEVHLGALGFRTRRPNEPGTIKDLLDLLDYLQALGVNAVELLPLSEFGGGGAGWGYGTSHYFAIEYGGGGRDQYKHLIRECHKRGIAVILDVVYNHYHPNAERAEWMYDTVYHERNPYYWYEGRQDDYPGFDRAVPPDDRGQGGYVDNMSTGWAPRYWEETIRGTFISSAIAGAVEFGLDGFRVDQTTSIHSYNVLHADGRPLGNVNAWGARLLRELTRTLRLVKPGIMLMAEDHSGWDGVTRSPDEGGLGFDAAWYADFYHHLIGDTDKGSDYAKLIKTAGLGDDRPLAMDYFAGALDATSGRRIAYHESHDEAGNGLYTHRTIQVAVNGAPLVGETRRVAEARCRFAAGMTLLSAAVPMFLFGEEVGAEKDFLYNHVLENREDLEGLRTGSGQYLFAFYSALIRLRLAHSGLKSGNIETVFVHNDHRLLVFRRWSAGEEFLVVSSLNNRPFDDPGYIFNADRIPAGRWREIFNSDAAAYGGDNRGNGGETLTTTAGRLECVVPAHGFIVFEREA
jgi:1,4-alpha-glucan branching enzyme